MGKYAYAGARAVALESGQACIPLFISYRLHCFLMFNCSLHYPSPFRPSHRASPLPLLTDPSVSSPTEPGQLEVLAEEAAGGRH